MYSVQPISAGMLDAYVGRSDVLIIDLREPRSYRKAHVSGAVNLPYAEMEETGKTWSFPRGRLLIFYCDRGGASMAAAKRYAKLGYETRSVIGGFEAYRGRNLVISR